jgi:hypothetical protein
MRTRTMHDFPAWLERLRRRFERWRQTRDGRSRIPEALWASAVKAAGRYGLNPTARALGLDYYSLKRRVEVLPRSRAGRTAGSRGGSDHPATATFVEWPPLGAGGSPECIVELEDAGGAKMRVHLKGIPTPDWAALSRSFWRRT